MPNHHYHHHGGGQGHRSSPSHHYHVGPTGHGGPTHGCQSPDLVDSHYHHHHHVPGDEIHKDHKMLDLVTTLRSELAAANYKRDRLINQLAEARTMLSAKDQELEKLHAQTIRQSTQITDIKCRENKLEKHSKDLEVELKSTTQSLIRDKRTVEEQNKDLASRLRRLESDLVAEESARESFRVQLHDLIRRLCLCLAIDVCDSNHLTADTVLNKTQELVADFQRVRTKMTNTSESLNGCESELISVKTTAASEKQRLSLQLESMQSMNKEMEARLRQAERDLQINRDRLADSEVSGNKLREELRGFESRCSRLQTTLDRLQNDRLQFLRGLSNVLCVPEPCETLIKDKVREICSENQAQQTQLIGLREELSVVAARHREDIDTTHCRLRTEEAQKCSVEERLEKTTHALQIVKAEHMILGDFLVRLSRALCWAECVQRPQPGTETTVLAETLLERAERMAVDHDHHVHDKHHACDEGPHQHHSLKLRRERSCHDLPLKESSALYTLQRRVRVLREQVQRRDMHLELLRRKLAVLEDAARGKFVVQNERDEAMNRARRSTKNAEKTTHQLAEVKHQLAEVKAQLSEAIDYKITALERARKIDELQSRIVECEGEKSRLQAQVSSYKNRARTVVDESNDRCRRDEQTIVSVREELTRMKTQLADTNHRLSQLQTFRSSVARLLHLRDVPHEGILQRLQTLCNAHQEFTLLSRRYESASPVGDHPCPRYDDPVPPSIHCRPISSSSGHHHNHRLHQPQQQPLPHHQPHPTNGLRYEESTVDDQFDDDFDYAKKFNHHHHHHH